MTAIGSDIQIVEGQAGWLFLSAFAGHRYLEAAGDLAGWERRRLPRLVANYVARHRRVAERGIPFVVLICPEAAGIYPEHLPAGLSVALPTAGERLAAALNANGVRTVCPSAQLRDAKGGIDLYCRLDSHWSSAGAYLGYRALMEAVRERLDIPAIPWHRVWFGSETGYGDLGIHATPERKGPIQSVEVAGFDTTASPNIFDTRDRNLRHFTCRQGKGRALVFRDSFAAALTPYLQRTFAELTMVAPSPAMVDEAIDLYRPDLVVLEVAERALFADEDPIADWGVRTFAQDYLELNSNPATGRLQVDAVRALTAGQTNAALVAAATAVAMEQPTPRVYNLAWTLRYQDAYAQAHLLASRYADRTDDRFLHFLSADCLNLMGRKEEAVAAMEAALRLQPKNGYLRFVKGAWLLELGRTAEARDALEGAVAYAPLLPLAWDLLDGAYAALGDSGGRAEAAARRFVVFGPPEPDDAAPAAATG